MFCRSFFSKSPAPSKAKNEPSPGANGSMSKEEANEVKGPQKADSPVLKRKSKRRRVIIDSEDEDEGGVVGTKDGDVDDVGVIDGNSENGIGTTTPMPPSATPTTSKTVISSTPTSRASPTSPTSRPVAGNDVMTKTPPRRNTGK